MRFLCDEMLAGLGRWLRAAGYDTAVADPGTKDREVLERAWAEDRLLLTRDRRLIEIRGAADRTVVLLGNGIDACAAELSDRIGLDWRYRPLSRCLACNTLLVVAGDHLRSRIPERARALPGPLTVCPTCDHLYWTGSHVRRMQRRLASFARSRPRSAGEEMCSHEATEADRGPDGRTSAGDSKARPRKCR